MQCCMVKLWILIIWLSQKPVDLDLEFISIFKLFLGISKVRGNLRFLCIICSLGQVKFSLDKYSVVYGNCKLVI